MSSIGTAVVSTFLSISSGLTASVYGFGEKMCGDVNRKVNCSKGALTASGVPFNPEAPQIAIAIPKQYRLRSQWIYVRTDTSPCVKVHLVDKMNQRWVGTRGFDVTPKVLELLGEVVSPYWTGTLHVCTAEEIDA